MSAISLVLFVVSLLLMLGGIVYYILVGSKQGELNPFKAAAFIFSFVLAGMIVAMIAIVVQ
jgi:hypothetical protein